jgi:Rieske Fe-S protein
MGLVLAPTIYATTRVLIGSRSSARVERKDIGAADGFQPEMSKTVPFGNTKVLVARDARGQLHAVSGICTHMGCSVRFEAAGSEGHVVCNCHESKFSVRGENLNGPATRPLTEYHVESVGGRLMLTELEEAPGNR